MFSLLDVIKEAISLYISYWWVFTPLLLFPIFQALWMSLVQIRFLDNFRWTLLEVNVLKEIEKGPKAAEEFIAALHGVSGTSWDTIFDIYIKGTIESYYSLEIASIEGNVHFYIQTPTHLRDLVESQIYAQYPDADITQVEDYAKIMPRSVPSEYNLWGCEWTLEREDAYPIRTYIDYEDTMATAKAVARMIDPMANFVEGFGKMGKGEQMWLQILIRPVYDGWKEEGLKLVAKLIGKKAARKPKGLFNEFKEELFDFLRYLREAPFKVPEAKTKKEILAEEEEGKTFMLYLSPGETKVVEAIERNIAKVGFETKIRWLYLGKKEFFNKARGVLTGFGMFAQFRSQDLNYFHVDRNTKTSAYYFLTEQRLTHRKRVLVGKYKKRLFRERSFILNSEEIATLYHYPTIAVRQPMAVSPKPYPAAPPAELPIVET